MTRFRVAIIALLLSTLIGSSIGVSIKAFLSAEPVILVWFLRTSVAAICFLPIFIQEKPWQKRGFLSVCLISTGAAINTGFFIVGLQFTSASVTPLIYALIPICILFYEYVAHHKKPGLNKISGTVISLIGIIFIFYRSIIENGSTIIGSWLGNGLIFVAMLGWVMYLIGSKQLSNTFSSLAIASTSVLVTWLLALPFLLYRASDILRIQTFSLSQIYGVLYLGIFGTFIMYILNQYCLSQLSAFIVGLSNYLMPLSTIVIAGVFLHEVLTINFVIGSMLVLSGLFISTTYEVLKKRAELRRHL